MTALTDAPAVLQPVRAKLIRTNTVALTILLAFAVVIPFLISDYRTLQMNNLVIYAISILGLNLLTGFSGQISLGNGAFWALGAYSSVILIGRFHVPYWMTPLTSAAVCFGVGYLFGRSATRLEGLYLALATFALAIVTPQLLKLDAIEHWTGGTQGVNIERPTSPVPDTLSDDKWLYFFTLLVAIILYILAWNIVRGRTGRALIALRDHPIAAGAMGINTVWYRSMTFGVSAAFTGVAGALSAITSAYASPDSYPAFLSTQLLVGSVVGGIFSIWGSLFGAAFIQFVQDFAKQISDAAPFALYGILLIIFMVVMPWGMAGLVRKVQYVFAMRRQPKKP